MIARSRLVSIVAVSIALVAHGFGLDRLLNQFSVDLEGTPGTTEASIGNSFADMATGLMTPQETGQILQQVTPAQTPQDMMQEVIKHDLLNTMPQGGQDAAPTSANTKAPGPVLSAIKPTRLPPDAPSVPVSPANSAPPKMAPRVRPESLDKFAAVDTVSTAVTRSMRPRPRTPEFENRHVTKPPKVTEPRQEQQAQPQGNNADQNAVTGSAQGTQQGKKSTAAGTGQSTAIGNAAASNYPGKVMKRISSVPRPRVGSRGTAVVAFRIGSNGRLSALSLARSSGSATLDQAALKVIRLAAPFPPPPSGARRSFSIQVKGR